MSCMTNCIIWRDISVHIFYSVSYIDIIIITMTLWASISISEIPGLAFFRFLRFFRHFFLQIIKNEYDIREMSSKKFFTFKVFKIFLRNK